MIKWRKLTGFTIVNRFGGLPLPVDTCPNGLPQEHFDAIKNKGGFVWAVGSRTIEGAARSDSDYDFLVLSDERMPDVYSAMGYELLSGGRHYDPSEGHFNSWMLNGVNIIATDDIEFAVRFVVANETAKAMRLLSRADRVTLFQAVLYTRLFREEPTHD